MKRILFAFILTLVSFQNMFAQIEMFDESIQKRPVPKALPYDSLSNFVAKKYGNMDVYSYTFHHLVGQKVLFCGDPDEEIINERSKKKSPFEKGSYYIIDSISLDRWGHDKYGSLYFRDTKTGKMLEDDRIFSDNYNFKWVVVGHYEKMKSLYLNKEFVYVGTDDAYVRYSWEKANGFINLETDTITKDIKKGSIWTCTGVQVKPRKESDNMRVDKRSPIVLIFDNPKYGKHYCYLEAENGEPYKSLFDDHKPYVCGRFLLKSYYDNVIANQTKRKAMLTKKYGAANAKLIVDGYVRVGMTKAMCKESWGEPYEINKTIGSWGTHEQWVYGSSYLYFEGNKLTSIQN